MYSEKNKNNELIYDSYYNLLKKYISQLKNLNYCSNSLAKHISLNEALKDTHTRIELIEKSLNKINIEERIFSVEQTIYEIEESYKNLSSRKKIEYLEKNINEYLKEKFLDKGIFVDGYPYKCLDTDWYNFYAKYEQLYEIDVQTALKYVNLEKIAKFLHETYLIKNLEIDIVLIQQMVEIEILKKFPRDTYLFKDKYKFRISHFKDFFSKPKENDDAFIENICTTNEKSEIYLSYLNKEIKINNNYTIIGIGGCGSNIVNYLANKYSHEFNCLAIDSNKVNLNSKEYTYKLQLLNNDFGCGGNFNCGYSLINDNIKNEIDKFTQNKKDLYIVSSISKGVGSGSTVAIAEHLATMNKKLTFIIVLPFNWELSNLKKENIKKTIGHINQINNIGIVVLDNSQFKTKYDKLSLKECLEKENELIVDMIVNSKFKNNVKYNTRLITKLLNT